MAGEGANAGFASVRMKARADCAMAKKNPSPNTQARSARGGVVLSASLSLTTSVYHALHSAANRPTCARKQPAICILWLATLGHSNTAPVKGKCDTTHIS
jgi:hypothetical protein